jgi:DNA uptake protein ComE-like DNA-binding protein
MREEVFGTTPERPPVGPATDDPASLTEQLASIRSKEAASLLDVGERLAAEAESGQTAALERLNATVLAAFREETEELRAEHEAKLAESVQAIERAAEKRGRQAAAERAAETSILLSNAVKRVSEREARRIEEEIRQLDRAAEDWRARLTEVVDRRMKDRATRLAEEADKRKAAMDARFDVVLEAKTKLLVQRVEDAIAYRHRELVARMDGKTESSFGDLQAQLAGQVEALEQAARERAEQAQTERDEKAVAALSELEERLTATVAESLRHATEQAESQLADHVSALGKASEERSHDAESNRAEELARAHAEMDKWLRATLADQLTETLERNMEDRARLEDALETSTKALAQRLEGEIADRHRELVSRVERQVESSLGGLQAQLAGHAEALRQAVSERAERALQTATEQAESQLADHVSALGKASEERSHDAEANRADELAAGLAEMGGRLDAALAGHQTEADRIRERGEAFLVEGQKRLEQLAEDLRVGIAEAAREAGRASEEGARYIEHLRALGKGDVRSGTEQALDSQGVEIDANTATVDDLRGLDLSLTQATRFISHRDALGGFTSLRQVDDVPGISGELRTKLKRRLAISDEGEPPPRPAAPPARPTRTARRRLRPGRGGVRAR